MNYSTYAAGYTAGVLGLDEPTMLTNTPSHHFKWYRDGWSAGHRKYLEISHNHLGGLVNYLLRNYPDDQWDDSTKEMIEDANAHLGGEPIKWSNEDDEGDEE